jgi:hypothetical protein
MNLEFWSCHRLHCVIDSIGSAPPSPSPHLICLSLPPSLSLFLLSLLLRLQIRLMLRWIGSDSIKSPSLPLTPLGLTIDIQSPINPYPPLHLSSVTSWVTHGCSKWCLLQHWNAKNIDQERNAPKLSYIFLHFLFF